MAHFVAQDDEGWRLDLDSLPYWVADHDLLSGAQESGLTPPSAWVWILRRAGTEAKDWPLTTTHLAIAETIVRRARNVTVTASIRVADLAAWTWCTPRTIRDRLPALADAGWIEYVPGRRGDSRPIRIVLTLPDLDPI